MSIQVVDDPAILGREICCDSPLSNLSSALSSFYYPSYFWHFSHFHYFS